MTTCNAIAHLHATRIQKVNELHLGLDLCRILIDQSTGKVSYYGLVRHTVG